MADPDFADYFSLKGRLKMAIAHLLRVVDAVIYLGSLSLVRTEFAAAFLFSDILDDEF